MCIRDRSWPDLQPSDRPHIIHRGPRRSAEPWRHRKRCGPTVAASRRCVGVSGRLWLGCGTGIPGADVRRCSAGRDRCSAQGVVLSISPRAGRVTAAILSSHRSSFALMLAAASAAVGIKAYYSRAGADQLLWILAPSAWLAKFVGGIDLVYEQGAGYISHKHHLVVGPSCAGVNFLVICFLCLYFSFARRFDTKTRWFVLSAIIAFAGTVATNGLRIFVSAHLWDATFYRTVSYTHLTLPTSDLV